VYHLYANTTLFYVRDSNMLTFCFLRGSRTNLSGVLGTTVPSCQYMIKTTSCPGINCKGQGKLKPNFSISHVWVLQLKARTRSLKLATTPPPVHWKIFMGEIVFTSPENTIEPSMLPQSTTQANGCHPVWRKDQQILKSCFSSLLKHSFLLFLGADSPTF
jgi:hypothetical protein